MTKNTLEQTNEEIQEDDIDTEILKEMLSNNDELPRDLGELVLAKLAKGLKEVATIRKLKKNGYSPEQVKKHMKNSRLSEEELEKQIALHDLVLEHKDTFLKILEEEKRPDKIRASGHYWDNKLKYSSPNQSNDQLTISDYLEKQETKHKIEKVDYEVNVIGINLTPPENKLMNALIKLLNDKSNTRDSDSSKYFTGNYKPVPITNYGGTGEQMKAPTLQIKPSELFKSYLDSPDYSGQDIKYINALLESLASKKFVIHYERKKYVEKNGKKQRLTDVIEDFQPLIRILKHLPNLTDEELAKFKRGNDAIVEKKGEYLLGLNPVLVDQIATKYVEFPRDIEKRTVIAAGGHKKVTESDIALRDYMLRELSAKRYTCEINDEKLPYILKLDGYIKNRKKKIIQQRITNAINVSKSLGLIQEVEIEIGKLGQSKYIFILNPNYN